MYLPSRQKNSFTGRKKSFLDWFHPTSANSIAQSSMCCHVDLNKAGFDDSTKSLNRSWKLICHVSWQCHWLLVGLLAKCTSWFFTRFFTPPPQHKDMRKWGIAARAHVLTDVRLFWKQVWIWTVWSNAKLYLFCIWENAAILLFWVDFVSITEFCSSSP